MRSEFLKFQIRKFSIPCSVSKTRERIGERIILKNKIKVFEQNLEDKEHSQEYWDCKRKPNDIFDRNG